MISKLFLNDEGPTLLTWIVGIFLAAVVFMTLFAGIYLGMKSYFDPRLCERRAERLGLEWNWDIREGCYVQLSDGQWVPYDKLRFDVEDE